MYLNTPTTAVNIFGQQNQILYQNMPLYKFQFACRIVFNPVSGKDDRDANALTFIIKSVDLPQVTFQTETMNEYNRSRLVYSKVNYSDCNVVLHDVADGKVMRFWHEYFRYYAADPRSAGYGIDTSFIQDNNRRYMIDQIDIFQFQAGKANKTTLMYPKITGWKPDTLNYEEVSGLAQSTLSIRPEYVKYETNVGELPSHVLEEMERGMPLEIASQTITSALSTMDPIVAKQAIADDLAANMGRQLNDQVINRRQGSFDQPARQPAIQQQMVGSSLSSLGSLGLNNILVPTPIASSGSTLGGAAVLPPAKLGNVNSTNQQGGRR